jgi:phosphoribosylanthranilate isomerase
VFIKICGMTTSDAVHAAAAAGADAVGFVFAPSSRRVTPDGAAKLAAHLSAGVLKVAVTHHPEQSLVDEIFDVFAPDYLQSDIEDFDDLELPPGARRLPVLRASKEQPAVLPARVLFEGPASGTGKTSDWDSAAALATKTELILGGGLNAENVSSAIARVRPFGIDVSTGVERSPGVKDPKKIEAFVRAARNAAREERLK